MRRARILGGILVAAAVLFPASASPRAAVNAAFQLALPAADKGVVYALDVTLQLPSNVHLSGMTGTPFSVAVTNQQSLPTYIRAAAAIAKTSSQTAYKVYIAINAPKGKIRRLAADAKLNGSISVPPPFTGATVKQEPGDHCSDLMALRKAIANLTMIGSGPAEGPDIEKHTEGADPNCKKPPPTTTATTKSGPCEATPLPKECRFDLAVTESSPTSLRYKVGEQLTFHVDVTVTNVGTATSDPAAVVVSAIMKEGDHTALIAPLPGCSNVSGSNYVSCPLEAMQHGVVKHFTFTVKYTPRHAFDATDSGSISADVGTIGVHAADPSCDGANEVGCGNNVDRSRVVYSQVH